MSTGFTVSVRRNLRVLPMRVEKKKKKRGFI
jgi:hypothetical protein